MTDKIGVLVLSGTILSYHPPIFRALKRLTLADEKQSIILKTVAAGVSIISPHTALDSCTGGINDWLADGLGSSVSKQVITPFKGEPIVGHETAGSGRIATLSGEESLKDVVGRIKKHLGLQHGEERT
jgi:putative NIF3 family GTP cyclohydrolase 1 type 2